MKASITSVLQNMYKGALCSINCSKGGWGSLCTCKGRCLALKTSELTQSSASWLVYVSVQHNWEAGR